MPHFINRFIFDIHCALKSFSVFLFCLLFHCSSRRIPAHRVSADKNERTAASVIKATFSFVIRLPSILDHPFLVFSYLRPGNESCHNNSGNTEDDAYCIPARDMTLCFIHSSGNLRHNIGQLRQTNTCCNSCACGFFSYRNSLHGFHRLNNASSTQTFLNNFCRIPCSAFLAGLGHSRGE